MVSQASGMRNSGAVKVIEDKAQLDRASAQGHVCMSFCYEAQDIQKQNGRTTPFNQASAVASEA